MAESNEILEKLKKDAGIEIDKGEKKDEKKEPTLEEVIATVRDLEARELLEAKARQMRAEFDARTRELETRYALREGGGKVTESTTTGEKTERWSVVDRKPIKDSDGEYETFAQAYKVAALETQATAVAAAEKNNPIAFFQFLQKEGLMGGKTDSFAQDLAKRYLDNIDNQLRAAVESRGKAPAEVEVLREEIVSLREEVKRSSDPIEGAKKVKGLFDALRDAGVIPEPSTGGEPIEHLKEKHRHEEKMEEIEADREYKTTISKTLGEIPERVGRGIAAQIAGEEEEGEREGSFPTFNCECGHKIVVPPEAGETITCGKCGAIYKRKREELTEAK